MIEKSRLEELIKQGATIYEVCFNCLYTYNLDSSYYINEDKCLTRTYCDFDDDIKTDTIDYLEKLFETKEEAEFALRYKHIPRTEYLDLPTWEEITTNDKYNYYGTSYFEFGDGYRLIVKLPSEDDDCEFIGIDVNGNCELYHWEETTKENYIKACELCRKLFLGEVEE